MKPLDVDVDGIILEIGHIGKYQIKHFLWTFIPVVLAALHSNNYIFSTPDVVYRCKISECDGPGTTHNYDTTWLSNAIPEADKCNRYVSKDPSWNSTTECPANLFDKNKQTSCDEYVFRKEDTFVEEVNIPCESWKRTLIGTMHSVGTLFALPIIGAFSDKFGRRQALLVASMFEGALGIVKSLSVNYGMFAAMELLEATFGSGTYTSAYILALEILTPTTRVAASGLINIYFASGQIFMSAIAWGIPYWRTYLQVIYAPSLLLFTYYWIIEESLRWMITKLKYQEALDVITKIAKDNKKTLPEKALEGLRYNIENKEKFLVNTVDEEGKEQKPVSPFRLVLRSKILMLRVLKASVWWITCTFCFYGLSINSTSVLKGNMYVNYMLSATVEIPAHFIAYFGLTYFGRKNTIFTAFLIGGICLVSFPFIPDDIYWLALIAYLLGKGCVAMAFGAVYLYTSELFPTPLRHSLLAMCSMIGRIGSILAPQTPLLAEYYEPLPSFLFAGACLISAALMLTSPETLNRKLPETIEEAENISKKTPK